MTCSYYCKAFWDIIVQNSGQTSVIATGHTSRWRNKTRRIFWPTSPLLWDCHGGKNNSRPSLRVTETAETALHIKVVVLKRWTKWTTLDILWRNKQSNVKRECWSRKLNKWHKSNCRIMQQIYINVLIAKDAISLASCQSPAVIIEDFSTCSIIMIHMSPQWCRTTRLTLLYKGYLVDQELGLIHQIVVLLSFLYWSMCYSGVF